MKFDVQHESINSRLAIRLMVVALASELEKELEAERRQAIDHFNAVCNFEVRSMAQKRRFANQRKFNVK